VKPGFAKGVEDHGMREPIGSLGVEPQQGPGGTEPGV